MDGLKEYWLILISTPFYLFIIGLELLLSHMQHRKLYTFRDTVTNIYLMLLNSVIDLAFRLVYLAIFTYFYKHSQFHWTHPVGYWLALILLEDFLYYWLHRFDHEIRFFWAAHVTHHSSAHINFTVGFRSSVFQPLYRWLYFLPLPMMGFKAMDIAFIYSATQIWGIFVHTELVKKMGWLEYILVTPSHHRVHHASNPKYLDKNMGMFLIIWDKMFGTFQAELPKEAYQPIRYGLTKNLEKQNGFTIVFHEWLQIIKDIRQKGLSFKQKLGYIFGPPGWSHDGSRQTSEEMRQAENPVTEEDTIVDENSLPALVNRES